MPFFRDLMSDFIEIMDEIASGSAFKWEIRAMFFDFKIDSFSFSILSKFF